ncbi:secreted RxLR effector protein 161-like [Nicotiana tabacum]|uniref:Secreted RxLR effector protein 161-like n=1 Tax=Nicotiana tabacum TaxID=4097 RepID=A0AC58TPY6_TOBAC
MARTMLIDSGIAKYFWAKAVNTACYLVNRCMIRSLLNKTSYKLLKRFDMETSKVIDTLIVIATHLDMDEPGSPINKTMYRGIIGSLVYLTASRPDIVLSVGLCARFQSNPKESHLKTAKRILRYLKGTQDLVLYYPSGDSFNLIGYAYTDYAGYLVDRKSTSGMTHFIGS